MLSEGAGEAAKIIGKKEKDLLEIESEAYKRVQEIRGAADAETISWRAPYQWSAKLCDLQIRRARPHLRRALGGSAGIVGIAAGTFPDREIAPHMLRMLSQHPGSLGASR